LNIIAGAVTNLVECAVVFSQIQNSKLLHFVIVWPVYSCVWLFFITEDDRPSLRDLNRYVIHKFASDWEDIGIELGLDEQIASIKKDYQQCTDCHREVLKKWLESTPHATWKTLEVAITNMKRIKQSLDPITDIYSERFNST